MKKIIFIFLILMTISFSYALGDRWDLIFSDGTTTINGTDICLDSGLCLSSAVANASGDITAVNTNGNYLYGGATSGEVNLYLNETYLNQTIDSIASTYGGGNSSFNQTLTDSLYIHKSEEGNLNVNSSSWWTGLSGWISGWFYNNGNSLDFNETKLNETIDARAAGATYTHLSNFTDDLGDRGYNNNLNFTNGANYWNDTYATFNKTYADTLYANISTADTQKNASGIYLYNDSTTIYLNESRLNSTIDDRASGLGDNSSWNESLADSLYLKLDTSNDPLTNSLEINGTGGSVALNIKNNLGFGVSTIELVGSDGGKSSFVRLGPNIPSDSPGAGGNASGLVNFNGTLYMATSNNESIYFGTFKDDNTSTTNFSVSIDPKLQSLVFQGNKFIRPIRVDGGYGLLYQSNDVLAAGGFPFIWLSRTTGGDYASNKWIQNGRNNSFSGTVNSFGVVPLEWTTLEYNESKSVEENDEDGINLLFNISDYIKYCDWLENNKSLIPEGCKYFADTTGRTLPLLFTGDLEVHRSATIHEGATIFDKFQFFTRNNNNFEIFGGGLYVRQERIEEVSIGGGGEFNAFGLLDFENNLIDPFVEESQDGAKEKWDTTDEVGCPDITPAPFTNNYCISAAETLQIIAANTSTSNGQNCRLNFWISSVNLDSGDVFNVTLHNSTSDEAIYSITDGTDVTDLFVSQDASNFDNQSGLTIRLTMDANEKDERVFLDNININCTAIGAGAQNVTRRDTMIKAGDGNGDAYFFYNSSSNLLTNDNGTWILKPGNLQVDNLIVNNITETESNVTGDSYVGGNLSVAGNTTSTWFFGLFNWTTSGNFLSFNGWQLDFNETLLNDTIDNRTYNFECPAGQFVKNLSANGGYVCETPSGSSGNPFDQVLNTTSNVTFDNMNITSKLGVKTSTPTEELEVNGTILVSGETGEKLIFKDQVGWEYRFEAAGDDLNIYDGGGKDLINLQYNSNEPRVKLFYNDVEELATINGGVSIPNSLGVGIANPSHTFHVYENNSAASGVNSASRSDYYVNASTDSIPVSSINYLKNTNGVDGGLGHMIGNLGWAEDDTTGKFTLFGSEGRVDGFANNTYVGVFGLGRFKGSDTSYSGIAAGVMGRVEIFQTDDSTPLNDGTAISFWAPNITGGATKYSFLGSNEIRTTDDIVSAKTSSQGSIRAIAPTGSAEIKMYHNDGQGGYDAGYIETDKNHIIFKPASGGYAFMDATSSGFLGLSATSALGSSAFHWNELFINIIRSSNNILINTSIANFTDDILSGGTINATADVCITGGKCLNSTIESLLDDTSPQLGGYLDTNGNNIGSTTDEINDTYVSTNSRTYYGDGQEASIYYNGTNLVISG